MLSPRQLFSLEPVATTGRSAATYVPWVMVARMLAFLRTLLVARLLGKAGETAFGLYQPALEIINHLVALVMFGGADVAERYVSRIARERGTSGVRQWLTRQWLRLALTGVLVAVLLGALAPWISPVIWGSPQVALLTLCAVLVLALALYQHVAATLRGLRAYGAAAGMEVMGAVLLLVASVAVAGRRDASWLIAAYLLSVVVPLGGYGVALTMHLRGRAEGTLGTPPGPAPDSIPRQFGVWAMLRLLLVLVFGFLSVWGVLAIEGPAWAPQDTAQFSMPWRIAQLLGFLAVTGWASTYGIAARAWSHGQTRRAKAQYFRMGRLGMAGLAVLAVLMLPARFVFVWILPEYAEAIRALLPAMLAVFLGYALLSFLSSYADLTERPWKGAMLWAIAITFQIGGIVWGRELALPRLSASADVSAARWLVNGSAAGLGAALLLAGGLLGWPASGRTTFPLLVLALASASLLSPWHVDKIAAPVILAVTGALYLGGYLVRRYDRRAFRRWSWWSTSGTR